MIARLARGGIVCLALACPAAGATAGDPARIDLQRYLELVERANPELAAARQGIVFADGERRAAGAYPNPELTVGAGPWRSRPGGASGTAQELSIAQPIDLPAVRKARIGAAEAGLLGAQAQAEAVRLAVGYQARQAFFELLRRQEEERIARENAELIGQIRDRVLKRVSVGEAPRFELVRAEAEALAAQNGVSAARLRVEDALAGLRRLAADTLPPLVQATGEAPAPAPLPPLAQLRTELLERSPALRALRADRERQQRRLEQERALALPQPGVRIGESRDPEMRASMIGLTVSVPLWNRREGQIAQARAGLDLAATALEREQLQLQRELEGAAARFSIAERQIGTFEAGLLRGAEAALQAAEAAYRFGERSFLEVLDAQRTLRVVRGDYNQARFDRVAAWLDLERLRGSDPFDRKTP